MTSKPIEPIRGKVLSGGTQSSRDPGAIVGLVGAVRAREDLVPGAGEGTLTINIHRELARLGDEVTDGVEIQDPQDSGCGHSLEADLGGQALHLCHIEGIPQRELIVSFGNELDAAPQEGLRLEEDKRDIGVCTDAGLRIVDPGGYRIGVGTDEERPLARVSGGQPRLVTAKSGLDEGHRLMLNFVSFGIHEDCFNTEKIMTLTEDGGADWERLELGSLGGPRTSFDARLNLANRDATDHSERCRNRGSGLDRRYSNVLGGTVWRLGAQRLINTHAPRLNVL